MKREILINGGQRETRVAILEDDRLVELLVDRPDHRRTVGDIYLGRVEAVLPGIQAAFVDIGQEKSAFLHASDLLEPDEDEEPEIEEPDDSPTDRCVAGKAAKTSSVVVHRRDDDAGDSGRYGLAGRYRAPPLDGSADAGETKDGANGKKQSCMNGRID